MARRIGAAAVRAGIGSTETQCTTAAFLAMIEERATFVTDEHDPDFLHTGRTAVILLEDVMVREGAVVAAAVLYDSMHPELCAAAFHLAAGCGRVAQQLLEELPAGSEDDAERVEALVTASEGARLVAVAERLDHARHLHLHDASQWRAFHEEFVRVFLPLAHRTHPQLAYRCDRWSTAFGERHLRV